MSERDPAGPLRIRAPPATHRSEIHPICCINTHMNSLGRSGVSGEIRKRMHKDGWIPVCKCCKGGDKKSEG